MTTVSTRIADFKHQEQRIVDQLTGPSRGLDRPALSKELAHVRRQIAMLTEDQRKPLDRLEQRRRFG